MKVSVGQQSYDIVVQFDGLNNLKPLFEPFKGRYSKAVIISDHNTFPLYGDRLMTILSQMDLPCSMIVVPAGESFKSLASAESCWEQMYAAGMDRNSLVIGLGGGTITDLAGFVASCYMRGVDVIHVPTTLLAMVDASIGGKTGINLPHGKNLIGTFHQPKLVLVDPKCLSSLPIREVRSGMAEVVKYAIIWDAEFFSLLMDKMPELLSLQPELIHRIVSRCCEIKAEVVSKDEKEHGLRSILNWGHTFGHALESLTGYTQYTHGEAISIGMSCAANLSQQLGFIDTAFVQQQDQLLKHAGLPTELPLLPHQQLIDQMRMDKKAKDGQITCIVAKRIGEVMQVDGLDGELIAKALSAKQQFDRQKSL